MDFKTLTLAAAIGVSVLGALGGARAATPESVSLFKIITVRDDIVVGLTGTELDGLGGARDAGAVAGAIAARGDLTVWQYAVRRAANGELQQAPLRRVGLLAHGSLRVEPYTSAIPVVAP
jgi:hypothetical protein